MTTLGNPRAEGAVIARCLIGEPATDEELTRYEDAMNRIGVPLTGSAGPLWATIMRHPRLVNPVDGALALIEPHNPLRQRLYVMLAILEASPHHTDHFLEQSYPRRQAFGLVSIAAAAALKTLLGIPVVLLARWTTH